MTQIPPQSALEALDASRARLRTALHTPAPTHHPLLLVAGAFVVGAIVGRRHPMAWLELLSPLVLHALKSAPSATAPPK